MKELWNLGDVAFIKVEPGCPEEFSRHGIAPCVNGSFGYVCDIEPRSNHPYRVRINSHNAQWFSPTELFEIKKGDESYEGDKRFADEVYRGIPLSGSSSSPGEMPWRGATVNNYTIRILSVKEACEMLAICRMTLYRWIRAGKVRSYKAGYWRRVCLPG